MGSFSPIAACLLLALAAGAWFRIRTSRLARSRATTNQSAFVEYFRDIGISEVVSDAVYRCLSGLPWMRGFPVEPKDQLFDIYRLEGEELGDAYANILTATGREMPESRKYDAFRVETVEELVLFVADLPIQPAV